MIVFVIIKNLIYFYFFIWDTMIAVGQLSSVLEPNVIFLDLFNQQSKNF